MRMVRALVVSLVLVALVAPTAVAHPKSGALQIPHEIMTDDAAWASTFGGTNFADLWEDLTAEPWGQVMQLPSAKYAPLAYRGPVPIGFNFRHMRGEYSACWVSPNGMIIFPDAMWSAEAVSGSSNSIKCDFSREPPNNYIAPFWHRLSTGGGRLLYATLGAAPNRRFVVEWLNVRSWDTGFGCTFEVQLLEGSNAILFLYKRFGGDAHNADWYTRLPVVIGMEDLSGANYVGDVYKPYYERMPSPVTNESVRGFVY